MRQEAKAKPLKTPSKRLYAQISSGKFKGKKLCLPSLESTRSTKNIVKACVFNVLRDELRESIFIEAFAGSALMALEALSNDAYKAYGIEKNQKAFEVALKNAAGFENIELLRGDTFELLPRLVLGLKQGAWLYFDPPFEVRAGFEGIYHQVFEMIKNLNQKCVKGFILEHQSSFESPLKWGDFERFKLKKFGQTTLSFYARKST